MPTDPATVPPLTEQEIAEAWDNATSPNFGWCSWRELGGMQSRAISFAHRVVALAVSRVDTAEVERRAGYNALTFLMENTNLRLTAIEACDVRDRHYAPAPAPRECVLSDKSVVRYMRESNLLWRDHADGYRSSCVLERWPSLLNRPTDTGADFDALKRFVAEVGQ